LEWWNRLLLLSLTSLLVYGFGARVVPAKTKTEKVVRAERLEIMDSNGNDAIVLGFDEQGSSGVFVKDGAGTVRLALAHDPGGSALFIRDSEGVIRVGVAQFAHGGGGVALHGPGSKGAAVLYFREAGSLTFYDPEGNPTMRLPEAESEDQGHSGRSR
jgi:hypothetical protein